MTRIAYVCQDPGVPVFGSKGGSIHVREVLRGFVRRGAEVTLHLIALEAGDDVDDVLKMFESRLTRDMPTAAEAIAITYVKQKVIVGIAFPLDP